MTRCQRQVMVFAGAVLALAGCTVGPEVEDPEPDPDSGTVATSSMGGAPTQTPASGGSVCALQMGTYQEVFAPTDANCPAIMTRQLQVGRSGTLEADPGCTASSHAGCTTTIDCSTGNSQTSTSSTLTITTGGSSAMGTQTVNTISLTPTPCYSSSSCEAGYCMSNGACYRISSTQTCHYSVAFSKI